MSQSDRTDRTPRAHQLRTTLAERGYLVGFFQASGAAVNGEVLALTGADFNLIDLEHGAGSYASLLDELRAVEARRGVALVRVPVDERTPIGRALDLGAVGVMIPQVSSVDQARSAVANLTYPPEGRRGVTTAGRTYDFGLLRGELQDGEEDRPFCICQVETRSAVAAADAIAATPGVDVLLIGPADLSSDLGVYGQLDHPDFVAACERVAAAASAHDVAAGIFCPDAEQQEWFASLGFTVFIVGTDTRLLLDAGQQTIARAHESVAKGLSNGPARPGMRT